MSLGSIKVLVIITAITTTAGCTGLWNLFSGGERRGVSSSLVDYLYPGGEQPPPLVDSIPELNVPLRVGLAFVPGTNPGTAPVLSEATRVELLERVRSHFIDRDYIAEIEVIPDTYMKSGRGFTSLDQISRLYDLDVMALVSYDQVVAVDDTTASFLYWTIIGAYLVEGSKNDVQTFVDTAVFDIPTRRLLIRAPGIDHSSGRSTLIDSAEELRKTRAESFGRAMDNMSSNLATELDEFKVRLEEGTTDARVVSADGGGGSITGALLLYILVAASRLGLLSRKKGPSVSS